MKTKKKKAQWIRVWEHIQERGHVSIIDTRYRFFPSIQNLADIILKIKDRKKVEFESVWVKNKSNSGSMPTKYKIYKLIKEHKEE